MIYRLARWVRPDPSPWWLVRPALVVAAAMIGLAHPDATTVLLWLFLGLSVGWWAIYANLDAAIEDQTDTQPIMVTRMVRCRRCGREQMAPAASVVPCQKCKRKMRVAAVPEAASV